jgi:hypothetical protein
MDPIVSHEKDDRDDRFRFPGGEPAFTPRCQGYRRERPRHFGRRGGPRFIPRRASRAAIAAAAPAPGAHGYPNSRTVRYARTSGPMPGPPSLGSTTSRSESQNAPYDLHKWIWNGARAEPLNPDPPTRRAPPSRQPRLRGARMDRSAAARCGPARRDSQ